MKRLLFSLLAAALCGCCSVKICKDGGRNMVEVKNYGWFLFGFAPIASGDPEYPNKDVSVWFCDSLLLDVQMMMLDDAMRQNGYRSFKNISSYTTQENIFFLFSRRGYHTSAELVR